MSIKNDCNTIAALASGKGNTALAIIRISGADTFRILSNCLNPQNRFVTACPKLIHLYTFINNKTKKTIDEITAIKYVSPESYTGENMVEIICHGNEFVIDEIFSILILNGVRLAKKGEFTSRAYLNNKIDLLKAESINQIIISSNSRQFENALEMFSGNSKNLLLKWKKEIVDIIVQIDAEIEFPEEDDIVYKKIGYLEEIKLLSMKIEKEIEKRNLIKQLDAGLIVPIIGVANAGKSSLFNLIMGFDRAIVHPVAGTTRDAISEEILIRDIKFKIVDTAGLNKSKNDVELLGIEKSWELIKNSYFFIWVTPAHHAIDDIENQILQKIDPKKTIAIISKIDLKQGNEKIEQLKKLKIPFIEACLLNLEYQEKIINFIYEHLKGIFNLENQEPGVICNKRQEEIFIRIKKKIKGIEENYQFSPEIISQELKSVLSDLGEFIGEITNDDILDSIFSEFCIGK